MSEEQAVNLKQRVIGAIVLVSLGVIILPLLLNGGSNQNNGISKTHIPAKPKAFKQKSAPIPAIKKMPEAKLISNKPVFKKDVKERAKEKSTEKTKPAINSKAVKTSSAAKLAAAPKYQKLSKPTSSKITTAYTLQLASFSQKSNSITLRDKLRKKGFKAYSESIQTTTGRIYRLRVGPYLKYDQILAAKKKIEKQFKLTNTVIVKYKT